MDISQNYPVSELDDTLMSERQNASMAETEDISMVETEDATHTTEAAYANHEFPSLKMVTIQQLRLKRQPSPRARFHFNWQ
jgi:hypothetical protein